MTTANITHEEVGRTAAAEVFAALAGWTPRTGPADLLHVGDLGWAFRFEDDVPQRERLHVWSDRSGPIAVGLLDGSVLRTALAPRVAADPLIAAVLADPTTAVLPAGEAWIDVADETALRKELTERGWGLDADVWVRFVHPLDPVPEWPVSAELVRETGAVADRVAVQVASFERSTFTENRWVAMVSAPGGDYCVDVLIRDSAGTPVAAATGWLSEPGRGALLEPVGTHQAHRGHGYGRVAVAAACSALAVRGASTVSVNTPQQNEAGVALYASAGFEVAGHQRSLYRPGLVSSASG